MWQKTAVFIRALARLCDGDNFIYNSLDKLSELQNFGDWSLVEAARVVADLDRVIEAADNCQ